MTFLELMEKPSKSEAELMLIQAIGALLTHPTYKRLSPDRIFELMRDAALRSSW